ncbi:MAG: diguanylate cyclase [Chromatiales bacterium]|nr:diguanylate cyclase [Chromatiales bacterium]
MEKVLLVEDSPMMVKVVKHLITKTLGFSVVVCSSMAETRKVLDGGDTDFLVAILDLTLPDAPHGEVVDYVLEKGIPSIVLTATFDESKREEILSKKVVDYVLKESRYSYDYVMKLISRLDRNRKVKALVVDDSSTARKYVKSLLELQNFQVLEANDGIQAMGVLQKNPGIKLLITDYNMPNMDGFELTTSIRRIFEKENMAIIGLSAQGSSVLSAKFIKNGANDFLAKPFSQEEFYCRIMQNMESIERIESLRDAANRDYLTKLYNRRYFYEQGEQLYTEAFNGNQSLSCAMLDIDFFKNVNDNYGHDAGDKVLVVMAQMLESTFGDALVARLGGEEFCILFSQTEYSEVLQQLEEFRKRVETSEVETEEGTIAFTVSIGLTDQVDVNLDEMLKGADQRLYDAKDGGRNQTVSG